MNAPTTWNLITAGPSRAALRQEHLLHDCHTVTVNRAIDVRDNGIKVHYAAFADGPAAIWEPLKLERHLLEDKEIQLWVQLRQVHQPMEVRRKERSRKGAPSPDFLRACFKIFPKPMAEAFSRLAQKYLMEPAEIFSVDVPVLSLMDIWDRALPSCTGMRVLPFGTIQDVNDPQMWRNAFTTLCALERIWMFRPSKVRICCADMSGPWVDGLTEDQCREIEAKK